MFQTYPSYMNSNHPIGNDTILTKLRKYKSIFGYVCFQWLKNIFRIIFPIIGRSRNLGAILHLEFTTVDMQKAKLNCNDSDPKTMKIAAWKPIALTDMIADILALTLPWRRPLSYRNQSIDLSSGHCLLVLIIQYLRITSCVQVRGYVQWLG